MKQADTPFDNPAARFEAGRMGMWLFLLVLTMLFGATILGYLVVRLDNGDAFIPIDAPSPPPILLASTIALMLSGFTMQRAVHAARIGDPRQGAMMMATLALAAVFLAAQALAWRELYQQNVTVSDNLYGWTFYVLTGLHAAHVLGGLPPMIVTAWRASHCAYNASNSRGVTYCAMYWHFLDGVWLVLYATLWFGSVR